MTLLKKVNLVPNVTYQHRGSSSCASSAMHKKIDLVINSSIVMISVDNPPKFMKLFYSWWSLICNRNGPKFAVFQITHSFKGNFFLKGLWGSIYLVKRYVIFYIVFDKQLKAWVDIVFWLLHTHKHYTQAFIYIWKNFSFTNHTMLRSYSMSRRRWCVRRNIFTFRSRVMPCIHFFNCKKYFSLFLRMKILLLSQSQYRFKIKKILGKA